MTGLIVDRERCIRLARYLNSSRYVSWDACPEARAFYSALEDALGGGDQGGFSEGEDGNSPEGFINLLRLNESVYNWRYLPASLTPYQASHGIINYLREEHLTDDPKPKFKEMLF